MQAEITSPLEGGTGLPFIQPGPISCRVIVILQASVLMIFSNSGGTTAGMGLAGGVTVTIGVDAAGVASAGAAGVEGAAGTGVTGVTGMDGVVASGVVTGGWATG